MPESSALLTEGIHAEKLGMLDRALAAYQQAANETADAEVATEAVRRQADVYRVQCEWETAIAAAQNAQRIALDAGLPLRYAEALNSEASVQIARGELAAARPLLERMVEATTDVKLRGIGLQNLGSVYAQQRNLDDAERSFADSYTCFRDCGYERGEAIALNNQGRAALDRGDGGRASNLLRDAVDAARNVGDEELIALALTNLAEATLATADFERAHELACTALGHFRTSGNRWREVECLRLLGLVSERRGDRAEAIRCFERGLRLAHEIDARLEIENIGADFARLDVSPFARP